MTLWKQVLLTRMQVGSHICPAFKDLEIEIEAGHMRDAACILSCNNYPRRTTDALLSVDFSCCKTSLLSAKLQLVVMTDARSVIWYDMIVDIVEYQLGLQSHLSTHRSFQQNYTDATALHRREKNTSLPDWFPTSSGQYVIPTSREQPQRLQSQHHHHSPPYPRIPASTSKPRIPAPPWPLRAPTPSPDPPHQDQALS